MICKTTSSRNSYRLYLNPLLITLIIIICLPLIGFTNSTECSDHEPLLIIIPANTSKAQLAYIQSEAVALGISLYVKDVSWDEDDILSSLSFELHYSNGEKKAGSIDYHDLNYHHSCIIYTTEDESNGLYIGRCNFDVLRIFADIYSSLPTVISPNSVDKKFADDDEWFKSNYHNFDKNRSWEGRLYKDLNRDQPNNSYYVNGQLTSFKAAYNIYQYVGVEKVAVKDGLEDSKDFLFTTKANLNFVSLFTAELLASDHDPARLKSGIESNAKGLIISDLASDQITYYYDGLETDESLKELMDRPFSKVKIERGFQFSDDNTLLGDKVKVHFVSFE